VSMQLLNRQSHCEDDNRLLRRAQHNICVTIALATARTVCQPPDLPSSFPNSLRGFVGRGSCVFHQKGASRD